MWKDFLFSSSFVQSCNRYLITSYSTAALLIYVAYFVYFLFCFRQGIPLLYSGHCHGAIIISVPVRICSKVSYVI